MILHDTSSLVNNNEKRLYCCEVLEKVKIPY